MGTRVLGICAGSSFAVPQCQLGFSRSDEKLLSVSSYYRYQLDFLSLVITEPPVSSGSTTPHTISHNSQTIHTHTATRIALVPMPRRKSICRRHSQAASARTLLGALSEFIGFPVHSGRLVFASRVPYSWGDYPYMLLSFF